MKKDKTEKNNTYIEPKRKLSFGRLILAISIISWGIYGSITYWNAKQKLAPEITYNPWFASYVDVTSTPSYAFEQIGATSDVILSFIVASKKDGCVPTWGTYYTLDEATISLDLERRIARVKQQGGNIAISFGGALNDELSVSCKNPEKLINAYLTVIEKYNLDTIDLDIEGEGLKDKEAIKRRALIIAKIQSDLRAKNKNLAVWVTLPVAPYGLTQEGTDVVFQMISNGVDLAGVNLMTMDYGNSKDTNISMYEASKSALIETHRQLGIIYQQNNINLSSNSLWKKIGATPMIGQNDILEEVFTIEDAKSLNEFAITQGTGRMSMWSANRDTPCGENYVDVKRVSDSCSGVTSPKFSFSQILSKNFKGDLSQNSFIQTEDSTEKNTVIIDDPDKSPYQIWQATSSYPKGIKIVWHGNVYEAKWWTKNDLPDNPVLQAWETPWKLVGPVLPGETPIKQPTLPKGMYPDWSGTTIYEGGKRILFEGVPYQAKWWNQGESPAAYSNNPDASPWIPLTQKQIEELLKDIKK